jgi:hypothetical protein
MEKRHFEHTPRVDPDDHHHNLLKLLRVSMAVA